MRKARNSLVSEKQRGGEESSPRREGKGTNRGPQKGNPCEFGKEWRWKSELKMAGNQGNSKRGAEKRGSRRVKLDQAGAKRG